MKKSILNKFIASFFTLFHHQIIFFTSHHFTLIAHHILGTSFNCAPSHVSSKVQLHFIFWLPLAPTNLSIWFMIFFYLSHCRLQINFFHYIMHRFHQSPMEFSYTSKCSLFNFLAHREWPIAGSLKVFVLWWKVAKVIKKNCENSQ